MSVVGIGRVVGEVNSDHEIDAGDRVCVRFRGGCTSEFRPGGQHISGDREVGDKSQVLNIAPRRRSR